MRKRILGKRFVLETCVGKGTYGEVWKCTDRTLKRTVAIKRLHGGAAQIKQLENEANALSGLTHKNIVVLYDMGSDAKESWLVMEFVEGPTLQDYLQDLASKGKWPTFEEARDLVEQILEALEFAHDKNRVHGDVKPANIFRLKTGDIKLGDFGVAKILGELKGERTEYPTGADRRLGSSSYAAPEVLNGQPRDFQSDLFSVGIVAYLLLTGQHPFLDGRGLVPILDLIKKETYKPLNPGELSKGIPEKYDKIVMRLLERDKNKRYKRAREVLDEWSEEEETLQCPECNTENPVSNNFCGQCGKNIGEALEEAREAESEQEQDFSRSFGLFRTGEVDEGIYLIQRSLTKHPEFAKGWSHLAFMLNHERRYEDAEEAASRSIKIDPESSQPYQARGFARSNLGKFDQALKDFTDALEREEGVRRQSMILGQRAYARKLSGDLAGSLQDATRALELDETNAKAQALKNSLQKLLGTNQ